MAATYSYELAVEAFDSTTSNSHVRELDHELEDSSFCAIPLLPRTKITFNCEELSHSVAKVFDVNVDVRWEHYPKNDLTLVSRAEMTLLRRDDLGDVST